MTIPGSNMKLSALLACVPAVSLPGRLTAQDDAKEEAPPEPVPVTLVLDLIDGTHLAGDPEVDSLTAKTDYADMVIPLEKLRQVNLDHTEKKAQYLFWKR